MTAKPSRAFRLRAAATATSRRLGKLVAGQPVDRVVEMLEGNTCGPRKTSCADQMTRALREAQGLVAE